MKKMIGMLAMAAALCGAAEYRIEANAMTQHGEGWAKHCDGTDGAMLLAKQGGIKLTGTYMVPEAGKYTVWVHTQTNNENSRKVKISLNGVSYGRFGDEKIAGFTKPCLIWKKALLPIELAANAIVKAEITATPYARIDCIVLSSNPEFDPSNMSNADIADNCEELESGE